jgi:hypothetical protein
LNVEGKAEKLIQMVASQKTSLKVLNKTLDQHWSCFEGDMCDLCSFVDENSSSILEAMAENSTISQEIQNRLYEAALLWEGREYGLLITLAANPSISEDLKVLVLDCDGWSAMNMGEEPLEDVFADVVNAIAPNPAFSESEVEEFKREFEESYL